MHHAFVVIVEGHNKVGQEREENVRDNTLLLFSPYVRKHGLEEISFHELVLLFVKEIKDESFSQNIAFHCPVQRYDFDFYISPGRVLFLFNFN